MDIECREEEAIYNEDGETCISQIQIPNGVEEGRCDKKTRKIVASSVLSFSFSFFFFPTIPHSFGRRIVMAMNSWESWEFRIASIFMYALCKDIKDLIR